MNPLILVSPSTMRKGTEFSDYSLNLSEAYLQALITAGATPVVLSSTPAADYLADAIARCDGVMLTGGEDIQTGLYAPGLEAELAEKVTVTEPERDLMETLLIGEIFQRRKPLFAICRGQQLLNIAFGGSLIVDIPTQHPSDVNHRRMDRKNEPVHAVNLAPESRLAALLETTRIEVNSTHHQAIDRLGRPFQAVGKADDGVIEAIELREADRGLLPWFVGVQFHPERLFPTNPVFLRPFTEFVKACRKR